MTDDIIFHRDNQFSAAQWEQALSGFNDRARYHAANWVAHGCHAKRVGDSMSITRSDFERLGYYKLLKPNGEQQNIPLDGATS